MTMLTNSRHTFVVADEECCSNCCAPLKNEAYCTRCGSTLDVEICGLKFRVIVGRAPAATLVCIEGPQHGPYHRSSCGRMWHAEEVVAALSRPIEEVQS